MEVSATGTSVTEYTLNKPEMGKLKRRVASHPPETTRHLMIEPTRRAVLGASVLTTM